ncbi:MAG TPA: glucosaminidase domain-containing protein [Bacteroidia bacterium]|nr:LysM peptidoglycan-binding domain-containing protein [Bacteroidetes bacterium CHB6]HNR48086.1 glucosaminidase domain-containing protein [Bacteroidia bacterium]HNT81317.1 glucosaminidase domain-containing protein [Bacteroidia bacterium]HRV51941.1 glucosaminidase domain-containing protein [Bacteroidia bacterium]
MPIIRNLTSALILLVVPSLTMAQRMTTEEYIAKYREDAIKDMVKTGVPACITLAQGILESESGNSKLAQEANNHFGIKCHKEWEGKTFHQDDDARDECFRKYSTVLESYDDHSDFLKTRSRYAFLFELDVTDYKGWAHGLKKAGYATNPNYAHKLIDLIERYNLEAVNNEAIARMNGAPANAAATLVRQVSVKDKNVSAKSDRNVTTVINITPPTYYAEQNNVKYVVSKKGDTWVSIAKENDMMVWQVLKYNDALRDDELREGTIVYIKPKRHSAQQKFHVVMPGESMRDISQMYAIKLSSLYKKNQIEPGTVVQPGTKLKLSN